jgi:hypothetical protein
MESTSWNPSLRSLRKVRTAFVNGRLELQDGRILQAAP